MNTKTKSNSIVTHALAGTILTFTVRDAGEFTLDTATLAVAIRERAMIHGIIQRISDRAAIERDTATGQPATPADKMARMQSLAEHYASGSPEWSPNRSGEGGGRDVGITYEAIARVKGTTVAEAQRMVADRAIAKGTDTKTVLADLRNGSESIIRAMAEIRASRVANVDTSLDDLK